MNIIERIEKAKVEWYDECDTIFANAPNVLYVGKTECQEISDWTTESRLILYPHTRPNHFYDIRMMFLGYRVILVEADHYLNLAYHKKVEIKMKGE